MCKFDLFRRSSSGRGCSSIPMKGGRRGRSFFASLDEFGEACDRDLHVVGRQKFTHLLQRAAMLPQQGDVSQKRREPGVLLARGDFAQELQGIHC